LLFKDPSITSQDTLLFYFAGHGVTDDSGEVFMASSETDSKEPFNGGFPFQQLTRLMNRSYSTRIITILDCCHSGAFEITTGSRGDPNDEAKKAHNDIEGKSNSLKQGRGKCLIAASESTQRAYEIKEKNHGIFTYYLLEGLRGKPQSVDDYGNVTVDRLADYVYDTISSLPPQKKPNQMPIRKAEGGGRIILASHPHLAKRQQLPEQTSQKDYYSILEFIDKARMLLEEEQYDNAIKIFDTILMLRPEHVEALNGKGMALYKQKKYKEALECFNEVLRIKPRNVVASDYLEMITDRISKERSGEAKVSDKDIKQDTVIEKRNEEKVKKGLSDFAQMEKALTDSTQIPSETIELAYQFYKKGRYHAAIRWYEQVLKIEPRFELAWYNKGLALHHLGKYQEAIISYDKALEIKPNDADVWTNKGLALHHLGKYQEAIISYDKALEIKPNDVIACTNKGAALHHLGKYQEANTCYYKALEIKPDYGDAWYKGLALDKPEKEKDVETYFKKAKELPPETYAQT
jgi:tetratricopeptide (TPR) repeat protein